MATETITVNVGGQPALAVAVEVEQVSGTAPPDFVATLRGLSPGDDVPINTYATDLDTYVTGIDEAQDLLDAAQAAGDVATAIALLSGSAPATFADRADALIDGDTAVMIVPTPAASPYLTDLVGAIASGGWSAALTILAGTEAGGYAGRSGTSTTVGASGPVQIPGASSIHLVMSDLSSGGSVGYLASVSGAGETEAANYLWSIEAQPTIYGYFAETGAGSNQSATWTRTMSAAKSRTVLLSLTRSSSGRLRLYENGTLLTATAVSGSGGSVGPAGAYVDLPLPTGGSSSQLWWGSDPTEPSPSAEISLIGIYDVEHDATKVLSVAQALGFA
jgi:hypothetical protein